jgi:hypothetical protein
MTLVRIIYKLEMGNWLSWAKPKSYAMEIKMLKIVNLIILSLA